MNKSESTLSSRVFTKLLAFSKSSTRLRLIFRTEYYGFCFPNLGDACEISFNFSAAGGKNVAQALLFLRQSSIFTACETAIPKSTLWPLLR
jgi:hypothetical protein